MGTLNTCRGGDTQERFELPIRWKRTRCSKYKVTTKSTTLTSYKENPFLPAQKLHNLSYIIVQMIVTMSKSIRSIYATYCIHIKIFTCVFYLFILFLFVINECCRATLLVWRPPPPLLLFARNGVLLVPQEQRIGMDSVSFSNCYHCAHDCVVRWLYSAGLSVQLPGGLELFQALNLSVLYFNIRKYRNWSWQLCSIRYSIL
jgi:hypothetical protein